MGGGWADTAIFQPGMGALPCELGQDEQGDLGASLVLGLNQLQELPGNPSHPKKPGKNQWKWAQIREESGITAWGFAGVSGMELQEKRGWGSVTAAP